MRKKSGRNSRGFVPFHSWRIYLNGIHIDTVYYRGKLDPEDVRRSLINHDGYPANIKVRDVGRT